MEENIDGNVAVIGILDDQPALYKTNLTMSATYTNDQNQHNIQEQTETNDMSKQSTVWTKEATLTLLSLYETKLPMLDNIKKKSRMWVSMSEDLKSYNIAVTPDQVRWKINALTKKYKQCVDNGQGGVTFKYFNEMHQILGHFNEGTLSYRLASGIYSESDSTKKHNVTSKIGTSFRKLRTDRKAILELEKQWINYLKSQEEQRQIRDERYERSLRLREEELELRKKELEVKQAIALKKLQLKEKKQDEILKIEKEKCVLLRKLLENQELVNRGPIGS